MSSARQAGASAVTLEEKRVEHLSLQKRDRACNLFYQSLKPFHVGVYFVPLVTHGKPIEKNLDLRACNVCRSSIKVHAWRHALARPSNLKRKDLRNFLRSMCKACPFPFVKNSSAVHQTHGRGVMVQRAKTRAISQRGVLVPRFPTIRSLAQPSTER